MSENNTTEVSGPFNQHVRRLKKDKRECLVLAHKIDNGVKYMHCLVWFTEKELLHAKPGKNAHEQWIRDDKLEVGVRV